jgi:hypothetical protein
MARDYGDFTRRGATIAAVSVDSPGRNAAMAEKLALPFPVLADPDGEGAIKRFAVWDAAGGIARTAIVALGPDGREVYRYVGVDFADRPSDDDLFAALDALGLPPLAVADGTVPHLPPAPSPRASKLPDLAVYMRGVRFATTALAARARDPVDKAEAERTAKMAERFIAAQGATLRLVGRG